MATYKETEEKAKKFRHKYSDLIDMLQKKPVNYNKYIKDDYEGGEIGNIQLPKKGGVLTEITGYDEPYRGFPMSTTIETLSTVKRMTRVMLFDVYRQFKAMTLLQKVRLFFIRKRLFMFVFSFVKGMHNVLRLVFLKPMRYSEPVREIYRVMTLAVDKEKKTIMKQFAKMLRDIVCMVLEFDNAYRFRLQDYAEELVIERLYFSKEDKAFADIRRDYKFRYKREAGNPDGLVVEPRARIQEKKLRDEVARIKILLGAGEIDELKELGVYDMLVEINTLSDEQEVVVKELNKNVEQLRKDCGFVLRNDRINELDKLLVEKVKINLNKKENANSK